MDFQQLKESGLLEQYVLGLTSPQEAELVESVLEDTPEARAEYDRLQKELNTFVEAYGMEVPDDGRPPRRAGDFESLDHEMILLITERNYRLTVWRYALGAACLVLLCLCGYLFRLNEVNKAEALSEKARRAQDLHSHGLAVEKLAGKTLDWSAMQTITVSAETGDVLMHYLPPQQLLLLDFSHMPSLGDAEAYYVLYGKQDRISFKVPANQQLDLHPLKLGQRSDQLRVYRAATDASLRQLIREGEPVARTVLAESLVASD